jgi:adenylate cyclase
LGERAIFHYVLAEHQKARELIEEMLSLAQQSQDPSLVAVSHWQLGFVLFALGEYAAARIHFEQTIAFYELEQQHPLARLVGSDARSSALAYDACCLWCLGYPDQAEKRSQEALALARELNHPFSLADALAYAGCLLNEMRRDAHSLNAYAKEQQCVARETVRGWSASAIWFQGEALAMQGYLEDGIAKMREGLEHQQFGPQRCYQSGCLGSLAKALAQSGHPEEGLSTLAEALDLVEQTDERYAEAELYRVQAELLLMQGDKADAEISLLKAIEVARRQSARSWELRATTSLARLWQAQGKVGEAHQALAEIYGWFTEGFDTADLREARALLGELAGVEAY